MADKIRVFILCSGLGRINRGYEAFSQECFEALQAQDSIDITLYKGGGRAARREIPLWNIPRDSWLARMLSYLIPNRGQYFVEQITFFICLLPYLESRQPDIVLYSDGNLGNLLWYWRRLRRPAYRLLFSNGGPLSPPFSRPDYVHQISSLHYQIAQSAGQAASRQMYIPYGSKVAEEFMISDPAKQLQQRERLGLPKNRLIVISVAAINATHKRLDYVVRELAAMPSPRPFLVMLGQREAETPAILDLAATLLGSNGYLVRTVGREEVDAYYASADLFVLASLHEGMGKVLVEALANGLPCLAHEHPVAREVLGQYGWLGDLSKAGGLVSLIKLAMAHLNDDASRRLRHKAAYERFSWERLSKRYLEMILACMKTTIRGGSNK